MDTPNDKTILYILLGAVVVLLVIILAVIGRTPATPPVAMPSERGQALREGAVKADVPAPDETRSSDPRRGGYTKSAPGQYGYTTPE